MKRLIAALVMAMMLCPVSSAMAVMPPKVYEARRIKAKVVYLAEVKEVRQLEQRDYLLKMSARLQVIKVFRGDAPSSGKARILYPSLAKGKNPPPGGTYYYRLKPGMRVLVFADGFDGPIGHLAIPTKKTLAFYSRLAGEMADPAKSPDAYGADRQKAAEQVKLYRRIEDYLRKAQ